MIRGSADRAERPSPRRRVSSGDTARAAWLATTSASMVWFCTKCDRSVRHSASMNMKQAASSTARAVIRATTAMRF